jgi:hypothetical protein
MFLLLDLLAPQALYPSFAIGLLYAVGGVAGVFAGDSLQLRWKELGEERAIALVTDMELALLMLVSTAVFSALAWGLWWNLPLAFLMGAVFYVLGGICFCKPSDLRPGDAIALGLLVGFLPAFAGLGSRYLEIGWL